MTFSGRCYIHAITISAGALTLGLNAPAHAQQAIDLDAINVRTPRAVRTVEAAGLAPAPEPEVGNTFDVITGDELQQRQIAHAADALRVLPGVAVSQTGGAGGFTQIRIRGAEANGAKVLIDGVEVNSLSAGGFDFSTLQAAEIERIEVLRGPQSGVYGANALAGVVNIITKKGSGAPSVSASAEGGSMGTRAVTANASGGSESAYLSITGARRDTTGFSIAEGGHEKDGSTQQTIFARGGLAPTDYFRVDAMLRHQMNVTDVDADADGDGVVDDVRDYVDTRNQTLARISTQLDLLDKRWTHKAFADYLSDDFKDDLKSPSGFLWPGVFANTGERRHWGYETQVNFDTPSFLNAKHSVVGLVEQKDESFEYNDVTAKRAQTGFATEYRGEFLKQFFLTGNIRRDDNDVFTDAVTWRTTAAIAPTGWDTRFHTSYGKGVTNPDFFQQFGYSLSFHGNPDLIPEQSIGWDAGVEHTFFGGKLTADITYFNADLTDKIVGYGNTVVNLAGVSKRQGIETQVTVRPLRGLSVTAAYTYTDASDADGLEEVRRPRHGASLNAAYTFASGRATVSGGVIYNGEMADNRNFWFTPIQRVTLGEYWLVNIAGSYKLDERFTLFGRIENLFDEKYQEAFGYASAPVAAYGGVKVSLSSASAQLEPAK